MADEYSDEEGESDDRPYHIIDKDGYIVVSLEAINKIRETIGKPKVGENLMINESNEGEAVKEVIEE